MWCRENFPSLGSDQVCKFQYAKSTLFACVWRKCRNNFKNLYIIKDIDAWFEFCIWLISKNWFVGLIETGVHSLGGFLIFFLPKETLGRKKPYVRGYHGVTGLWRQILKFHKVSFSFEIPFYGKILVQKIFSSSSLIFSKNRRVCDVIDPESDIVESRKNAFFGLLG